MLAEDIRTKMSEIERQTVNNTDVTLCVALSYGGRQEIAAAARCLAQKVQNGEISVQNIDEKMFADALYTAGMPEPDLLVRTSGEMRISNYLLWQAAYSELYFTPTLWPDFTKEELMKIVENYQTRERRYGKS